MNLKHTITRTMRTLADRIDPSRPPVTVASHAITSTRRNGAWLYLKGTAYGRTWEAEIPWDGAMRTDPLTLSVPIHIDGQRIADAVKRSGR